MQTHNFKRNWKKGKNEKKERERGSSTKEKYRKCRERTSERNRERDTSPRGVAVNGQNTDTVTITKNKTIYTY